MTAFKLDQGVLPGGTLNLSRSDLTTGGEEVTITTDVPGTIEFLWVPVGDAGAIASLVQDSSLVWKYTSTIAKPGTFRVKFTADSGGLPVIRAHRAPAPNGTMIPAFNEVAAFSASLLDTSPAIVEASEYNEPGPDGIDYAGWWFTYHDMLLAVDAAILAGPGTHRQENLATENITGSDTVLAAELLFVPVSGPSVLLFLNGIEQEQGPAPDGMYTISGKQITWLANTGAAVDMDTSDVLVAKYVS